jgi:[citrate (pro-3S)-lyase] ligase
MENKRNGLSEYLDSLPSSADGGKVGAIVMNANPFTLGHKALVERAAAECDRVFIFVLSEDKSEFSARDRLTMVRLGTEEFKNVTVLETGPYLISSATFPTYFIKDRDRAARAACEADIKIFTEKLAPRLNITHRYVGTEPSSRLTAAYNEMLCEHLPKKGITVCEIERVTSEGAPISASEVREAIKKGDTESLSRLLPSTTAEYLKSNRLI